MGPGKLLFFGSKETHGCKNFENRTTFRYARKRSKFYYITHLCEGVKKDFFFQILRDSHNVLTLGEKLPFRNLTFFVKRSIHTINASKKFLSRDKKVTSHTRHLNFLTKTERAICISINDKLSCQVPIGISVTQTQNLEAGFTYCFLQAPCGKQATLSPLHLYDPSFSFP